MTDYQLNNEDYDALKKFTTFFLVKAAQIIVQSRLGEKKTTKSKSIYSGSEWVQKTKYNIIIFFFFFFLVSSFN
jgi:autophagy-related protein 13